jgi:holo-[acyl-carrier protein] synthase
MLVFGRVIVGVGIDVIELARLARAFARHGERFGARVFTERERAECEARARPLGHFALRFAAKEAGMKAIGTGWAEGVRFTDFETVEQGRVWELRLRGRALEIARERDVRRIWLGASLTRTHAIAQVVLETEDAG